LIKLLYNKNFFAKDKERLPHRKLEGKANFATASKNDLDYSKETEVNLTKFEEVNDQYETTFRK